MGLDAGLAASGEWECMECGYIEEGVKTKRPQVCPDCGAPGQALEFFPYGDAEDEVAWDEGPSDDLDDELLDDENEDVRGL